jgi:protein arginine N-methyltransferase 1
MHAFISYFDVSFSACHKPIILSTSPYAKYTHWKQTVFYTKEVLMGKRGFTVSGKIACKPNEKNHRDMDISLSYKYDDLSESLSYQMS